MTSRVLSQEAERMLGKLYLADKRRFPGSNGGIFYNTRGCGEFFTGELNGLIDIENSKLFHGKLVEGTIKINGAGRRYVELMGILNNKLGVPA